jgi:hypothetical protein
MVHEKEFPGNTLAELPSPNASDTLQNFVIISSMGRNE